MPTILQLLYSTKAGYGGGQPPTFDLGAGSTIDYTSDINNQPPFSTYADPYLRLQKPTLLSRGLGPFPKYLDNPPQ